MLWMDYIALIATVLLIISVMLQQSADSISDAFSGEKSELFKDKKSRGLELFLFRSTAVLTLVIIVTVLLSNNLR
jgi:preprotein translocase subunit SecG